MSAERREPWNLGQGKKGKEAMGEMEKKRRGSRGNNEGEERVSR